MNQPHHEVADCFRQATAGQEGVERGTATAFEQREHLVGRGFRQPGETGGEEEHLPVHDRMKHEACRDAARRDERGGVAVLACGRAAFTDLGEAGVGEVAHDAFEAFRRQRTHDDTSLGDGGDGGIE